MSYQTYITEAIVCGSWDRNTADKNILLFARDAGMVYVHARSVRKEVSKQRYALQDTSHIRATLVRGKTGWKVAGVESFENLYALAQTRAERAFVRDTIRLLRRVMHGEEAHPQVFDDIVSACAMCGSVDLETLKTILFIRTLHALGYVARAEVEPELLTEQFPEASVCEAKSNICKTYQKLIDHALEQSQL